MPNHHTLFQKISTLNFFMFEMFNFDIFSIFLPCHNQISVDVDALNLNQFQFINDHGNQITFESSIQTQ
ncbi:hypothetical protein DERF_005234, partial [Dermatophagoides farinae]